MAIIETIVDVLIEHAKNVFGQFDEFLKKIEKALNVTIVVRDSEVKILGSEISSKDVVRHPLVQKIVKAYEDYENKSKPNEKSRRFKNKR